MDASDWSIQVCPRGLLTNQLLPFLSGFCALKNWQTRARNDAEEFDDVDKCKQKSFFSENWHKFANISIKWLLKLLKVICDITSDKWLIGWTNYIHKNVILLAIPSWRQWPKYTCQGKSNQFYPSPGFNKCPHVGYQTSSFFMEIPMELINFRNILKKSFRLTVKKRQAHKNVVTYQCDQRVAENLFLFF